jgi:hypothetical protein
MAGLLRQYASIISQWKRWLIAKVGGWNPLRIKVYFLVVPPLEKGDEGGFEKIKGF